MGHPVLFAALMLTTVAAGIQGSPPGGRPDFRSMRPVPLDNGPNRIDLDGDGRMDMVFVAYRENGNAHSFSQFVFYRSVSRAPRWHLAPFFDRADMPAFTAFQTFEGADCILRDLRLVRPRGPRSPLLVIVGERPLGGSFVDEARVTFTVYRPVESAPDAVGAPPFYYRAAESFTSEAPFCDVGEAFQAELGLARKR